MKPYELFLDTDDKQQFDRYNVFSKLNEELRDRVTSEIVAVIEKYSR